MDSLHAYAADWLRSHELFSFGYGRVNRAWLSMEESAHPGFTQVLRDIALAWLQSPNPDEQQRALRALAVLGVKVDLPQIDAFANQAGGELQHEAQRTRTRIRGRQFWWVWFWLIIAATGATVVLGFLRSR